MKKRLLKAFSLFLSLLMVLSVSTTVLYAETEASKPLANDLASVGQQTIYVGDKATTAPEIDGVFHASEYSWVRTFRDGDAGVYQNGVMNGATVPSYMTVGVAYDDDYIYLASVVQEDEYSHRDNSKYNAFVFNLGFDMGEGCNAAMKRMVMTLSLYKDGRFFAGNGFMTFTGNGTASTSWSYLNTLMDAKSYARGTDTNGKAITTYEVKVKKSVLKTAFGVEDLSTAYLYFWNNITKDGAASGDIRYAVKLDSATTQKFKNAYGWCPTFFGHMLRFERADVSTRFGAELRIAEPTGLRFLTTVDKAFYDELVEKHGQDKVTFGTLIAPAAYVKEAGTFTKEALDKLEKTSVKYLDVRTQTPYTYGADTYTFAGSIGNILSQNLELEFAAIGYVEADGVIYYSVEHTSRSASAIAIAALKDTNTVKTGEYQNEMTVNGKTVYSPYTAAQRKEINKLAVWGDDSYGASIGWEE